MEEVPVKQSRIDAIKERIDNISYKGVVLNVPFLIYLAILAVIYISNNNKGVALSREIEKKTKELEEVRWRYKDAQSELIKGTSEHQISERAKAMNIHPLDKPAFEIKKEQKPVVKED